MELFYWFFGIIAVILAYHFLTLKWLNPYKLTMVFGKKGSGKSTLLTKLALQYQKKGIPVFSTESIPGCYLIQPEHIGYVDLPPNSVLLVDEVGMIWDNRNFKNFKPEVRDWFKLQRHRKIRVFLFSQTFDVDKKIRDLTDEMYLVEKRLRVFSWAKRINKKIVLNKSTAESPSKIDEDLVFDPLIFFWCGSRRFTFIPKYAKYFDSFISNDLMHTKFEKIPPLEVPAKSWRQYVVDKLRAGRSRIALSVSRRRRVKGAALYWHKIGAALCFSKLRSYLRRYSRRIVFAYRRFIQQIGSKLRRGKPS